MLFTKDFFGCLNRPNILELVTCLLLSTTKHNEMDCQIAFGVSYLVDMQHNHLISCTVTVSSSIVVYVPFELLKYYDHYTRPQMSNF